MKTQKTKGFYDRENDTVHIFIPPTPTESERGGITAKEKTTESLEVTIDSATGKAYVALDKTLSKTGEAADAAVVGEKLTSMGVAIENVKEDITSKADKAALVKTDRKLNALWKLNQGISYEFQTDEAEAYQKTVPSGAKMASVKSIGGKTIVWNQLANPMDTSVFNGIDITKNDDNSNDFHGTISNTAEYNDFSITKSVLFKRDGRKYLIKKNKNISMQWGVGGYGTSTNGNINSFLFTANEGTDWSTNIIIAASKGDVLDISGLYINVFDLTQMFGSGNEPSTPEEFEAMFPADYYPYNAGELMSAPVNEVVEQGRNLLNLDEMITVGAYYGIPIYKNATATLKLKDGKTRPKASIGFIYDINSGAQARWLLDDGENITQLAAFETNISNDIKIFGCYPGNVDTINMLLDAYEINLVEGLYTVDTMPAYSPYHKTSHPIPQAILNLSGYGWSAGNVRNEVNWENKQYIQRVGKYVITGDESFETTYMPTIVFNNSGYRMKLGLRVTNNRGLNISSANDSGSYWQFGITDLGLDENATTDDIEKWFKEHPVTVYYPMFNEEIIDISDLIGNTFQEPLEVEAGGTLTFKNSHGDDYRIPMPSTEEYLVSLAEVAK
jgi:hypothetical protein